MPNIIDETCLLIIKSARNKLAHGETKFSNTCQDITLDEMKKMCKKLEEYLYKVICEYEKFLGRLYWNTFVEIDFYIGKLLARW